MVGETPARCDAHSWPAVKSHLQWGFLPGLVGLCDQAQVTVKEFKWWVTSGDNFPLKYRLYITIGNDKYQTNQYHSHTIGTTGTENIYILE